METSYTLKVFKNTRDNELIKALKLYSDNIEPAYRTSTKEILHWLPRYNKQFEDSFFILGLYYNSILAGFCEIAYFKRENFIIVDYLVIEKKYRGLHTFYTFLNLVYDFLAESEMEYDYVVVEIGYFNEKLAPPEKSRQLIKLLKMANFGVLKCSYFTARLGIDNIESEMKSVLMIYSKARPKSIKTATFFQIVDAIYYKYNQRWYNAFLSEDEKIEYLESLNKLKQRIKKELKGKKFIEINGFNHLFEENIGSSASHKINVSLTRILIFSIVLISVISIFLYAKFKFNIDITTISTLIYTAIGITVLLVVISFKGRRKVVSSFISKLFD